MLTNQMKCQDTRMQAVTNEYMDCTLRANGVGRKIDYCIGLSFFNLLGI